MSRKSQEDLLLGIDIGSGSVKAALVGVSGRLYGIEKREHSIESPRAGWAEVPIEDLWRNTLLVLRRLVKNSSGAAKYIRGIGTSCLCPGLTPLDGEGKALANSIIYMDSRSLEEVDFIRSKIPEKEMFRITGNSLMPGATSLTSILWLRGARRDLVSKTRKYGHINTYTGHKLTGRFGIDHSNASYTGLFETAGGLSWSGKLAGLFGLDLELLPDLVPSGKSLGPLINRDFIRAGVPEGIPVAMGGGDTACSALAVDVIEPNQIFESAGTTNVLTVCSDNPVFDRRFMNRCHVVPRRWLYHGAMSSTGASVKWLRDEIFELKGDREYAKISSYVDKVPPDESCPVFLPYMSGERSPVWDPRARGVFFGLSLNTKREHLVRALFEACAFGNRQLLEIVEAMTGNRIDTILSIGGWSSIDGWNRIKSDVMKRRIKALDVSEAASAGAALLGGMAAGLYESYHEAAKRVPKSVRKVFNPRSAYSEHYEKRYSIYTDLYPRLRDLYGKIG
jgi:xylulokinase